MQSTDKVWAPTEAQRAAIAIRHPPISEPYLEWRDRNVAGLILPIGSGWRHYEKRRGRNQLPPAYVRDEWSGIQKAADDRTGTSARFRRLSCRTPRAKRRSQGQ